MNETFIRTEKLIGREAVQYLGTCSVLVAGLGGVGGYVTEALIRSGIGRLTLADHDSFAESNLNRQILATRDTIGKGKAETARLRCLSINPGADVTAMPVFLTPEVIGELDLMPYDYIVDAIDNVTAKIALICAAEAAGVPVISSMGAGNRMDPTRFRVVDLFSTRDDPLAKVMRHELKKRGIRKLTCVWSEEAPMPNDLADASETRTPGSTVFAPAAAGLAAAYKVVSDLLGKYRENKAASD